MEARVIEYTITDDKIAIIKLNRVDKMNALTFEMFVELDKIVNEILN